MFHSKNSVFATSASSDGMQHAHHPMLLCTNHNGQFLAVDLSACLLCNPILLENKIIHNVLNVL